MLTYFHYLSTCKYNKNYPVFLDKKQKKAQIARRTPQPPNLCLTMIFFLRREQTASKVSPPAASIVHIHTTLHAVVSECAFGFIPFFAEVKPIVDAHHHLVGVVFNALNHCIRVHGGNRLCFVYAAPLGE